MASHQHITVTLIVRNHDQSIRFYCDQLGFRRILDDDRLEYPGIDSFRIVLIPPHSPVQEASVGRQSGDVAWLCIPVNNCYEAFERLSNHGVTFIGKPIELPYGIQATALDPDGNRVCLYEHW